MEILGAKWTDVAQLVATVAGFGLVYYQVLQLQRATQGATHTGLYSQYVEVSKLFLDRSHLRPYFYDAVSLDARDPTADKLRHEVEVMCELVTGLLEHAALEQRNLPGESWNECWKLYTFERFDNSPALVVFWQKNRHWYAVSFRKLVNGHLGLEP